MVKDIHELISIRKNWISVNRENNFEDGIKNLLSNMYPDEAHFIYELLQNAEDKKAKHVYFKMSRDMLVFEHDGGIYDKNQLFTLKDIESITGIGTSTKRDDNTTIGKFGVGFKAVFAYTETPQIYSGNYSFEINDLVVPKLIDRCSNLKDGITRFVFPFNSKTKDIKDTLSEIRKGLTNIKDNTLLFLENIESISYELDDLRKGEFLRIDEKNNRVTLLGKNNEETHWLRFDKQIKIEDEEDSKIKDCTINIAFRLKKDDFGAEEIVPTNAGVSIFFPAEKEISNLRFVINAPFASTIARDSVRVCKSNKLIISEFSIFIKEVLEFLYKNRYMKTSFYKVLPNDTDDIPEMYMPIFESIYDEYRVKPYFVTQDNSFERLSNVIKAYRAVVYELFSTADIAKIFKDEEIRWIKNPPLENSQESKFLAMFGIKEFPAYKLIAKNKDAFCDLVRGKDDKWFKKFLTQLWKEYDVYNDTFSIGFSDLKFLPTESGVFQKPQDCFYVLDISNYDRNILVDKRIYADIKQDRLEVNHSLIEVLEKLGVKEYNYSAQILEILKKYQGENISIDLEENISDVKKIINLSYGKDLDWDVKCAINKSALFIGEDNYLHRLEDLVLGEPYNSSFYALLKKKTKIEECLIADCYFNNEKSNERFVDFCLRNNVIANLKIQTIAGGGRIGDNYNILHLDKILKARDLSLSLKLWNFLKTTNILSYYLSYKRNGEVYDSDLFSQLKKYSWLPGKDSSFYKIEEIFIEDLPKEFGVEDAGYLISLLNIKSRNKEDEALKDSLNAKGIDIPISDLTEIDKFKKDNPHEYNRILHTIKQNDIKSFDAARRGEKDIEEIRKAPLIESQIKDRSVRVSESLVDATNYLNNWYHNEELDLTMCQICQDPMPFKKKNNRWYCEDVEMFKRTIVDKADVSSHLLLCPTCSAKYKEYIKNDESKQVELIRQILSGNKEPTIELDKEEKLFFSNKHSFDLRKKLSFMISDEAKDKFDFKFNEDIEREEEIETGEDVSEILVKKVPFQIPPKKYSPEQVRESYCYAHWHNVNDKDIIRIGYSSLRSLLFVDFKKGVVYFEGITNAMFNSLMSSENKNERIKELKGRFYSAVYLRK